MKGSQPIGVGRAGRESDVHRTALGSTSADFVGKARSWKEVRRRLVQADRHHAGLVIEDRLDAVAVVNVDVDVTDPLAAVLQ